MISNNLDDTDKYFKTNIVHDKHGYIMYDTY